MAPTDGERACVEQRVSALDWPALLDAVDRRGFAATGPLLDEGEAAGLRALYGREQGFRKTVVMERHAFGLGEYRYFDYPLPGLVDALRRAFYPRLLPLARRWAEALGIGEDYPDRLDEFLARCRDARQDRATPLLLRYAEGGYNCLHQDLYGEVVFPLQVVVMLNRPGHDFTGGDFLLVEQRPRAQSRGEAVRPELGEAVIFATRHRPVAGRRGHYRTALRHGVGTVLSGERTTLGLIFHDAS
jgi:uncharacterized protein